jgi:hypothetical protein
MAEKIDLTEKHTPFKPDQRQIRVNPMDKGQHISQADISAVAESTWYRYTLKCEHQVYSKIRIIVGTDYSFREHYIRCPHKHEPLNWQAIARMEAVSNVEVSNVFSGNAFILPNRILRVDGHNSKYNGVVTSGNPFPYVPKSSDREYW